MKKRKHHLLKNEIEMLQIILREEGYPTQEYKLKLAEKLENLKKEWYKVKKLKKDMKKDEKYYCSKHGNEGNPNCKECIENLKRLAKDNNAIVIGDFK